MAIDTHPALDEQFVRDFEHRYLEAWNTRSETDLLSCVTEDVHWEDPALPEPADGKEALAEFLRMSWRAMPDVKFSVPEPAYIGGENVVLAPWHMTGTLTGPLDPPGFAPTNQRIEIDGIDRWEFRDGLIARYRAFYDLTAVARQIGAMPMPGTRAERFGVMMQRMAARRLRKS